MTYTKRFSLYTENRAAGYWARHRQPEEYDWLSDARIAARKLSAELEPAWIIRIVDSQIARERSVTAATLEQHEGRKVAA